MLEFITKITNKVDVQVHNSIADLYYLSLLQPSTGTGYFTENELAALVKRDSIVGVIAISGFSD